MTSQLANDIIIISLLPKNPVKNCQDQAASRILTSSSAMTERPREA